MKYSVIILLVLFLPIFNHAQNKIIHLKYDFYFKDYFPENQKLDLICNNRESLSTVKKTIKFLKSGSTEPELKNIYTSFYKTRDSIISEEVEVQGSKYFIKEPLPQFNWKLTGNTKTILNYVCQEATVSFRGRNYAAYFTANIPFKVAPLKFQGLPGVVLALSTDDRKIDIQAKSLTIENFTGAIGNPFTEVKETITWVTFVAIYKKSWERFKNKVGSQIQSIGNAGAMTMGMPKVSPGLRMEIIVEGNDNH
jgi:GLPGLI family protein